MAKHCRLCDKPKEVRLVVKRPGDRRANEDYCQSHASWMKWKYRGTYVRVVKQIDLTSQVPKPAVPAQTSLNLEV
jgi:hypothetical protein